MHRFNLRVYGILINDKKQVLVSDEFIRGNYYTKFPGGGLEFGEGTRDCLKREFMEEMNLKWRSGIIFILLIFSRCGLLTRSTRSFPSIISQKRLKKLKSAT